MSSAILDAIGNTPLVEIRRLCPNPRVKILAKIEYLNPGGSVKDRPALAMIEDGEKTGRLTRDKIVIEATSGNTGIGLAMVCAVKGYRLLLAMSEAVSMERRKILTARGAEILLTPGHLGTDGAIEEVYNMVREDPDRYFLTDQFNNPANWKSHYRGTANEIIEQTGGRFDKFIATMGTTGTLMGCARRFAEYDSKIEIIGVEPYLGHKIQGLKNLKEAYRPEIFKKELIHRKVNIDDEDAFEMTRRLARDEGLFVGMSSGAAMAIAVREALSMEKGTIVVIFPDGGERYLSTTLFEVKKKADIYFYNTMSRQKEPFEPFRPGRVSMYTCGPTADSRMNIEAARRFVFSDLIRRYLEYRGFDVFSVMNITDFDDKTIHGSEDAGMSLPDFTQKYIDAFMKDIAAIGVKPADRYIRASEHLDDMVELAKRLYDRGAAYEKLRSLYFRIASFEEYGRLSGIDINKIKLGATVDLDEYEKDNPRDFTLLKRARLSELKRGIYTKSPWGNVRPSWHIQCAAMAMKHLGDVCDIHASSRDHLFPHHENVHAITKTVCGKSFVRYWMHCEQVQIDTGQAGAEKKLPEVNALVEEGFPPRVLRYWLVSSHYRKPLVFSESRLRQAMKALARVDACVEALQEIVSDYKNPEIDQLEYDIRQQVVSAMDDDLNTPRAFAALFSNIRKINRLISEEKIGSDDAQKILNAFSSVDRILGIFDFSMSSYPEDVRELIRQREEARKKGDFELADSIRKRLEAKGVRVKDKPLRLTH